MNGILKCISFGKKTQNICKLGIMCIKLKTKLSGLRPVTLENKYMHALKKMLIYDVSILIHITKLRKKTRILMNRF